MELYRSAQASPAELPGLVAGLGECGDARDVERVRPYLRHERPRVRAAAVRAFHRLGGPDEEVAALLTDPSPAVVRAVTRRRVTALPLERLQELLADAAQPRHVRQGAFHLVKTHGAWARVEADLLLLASDDPALGQLARTDLLAWVYGDSATVYTTPSPRTRERLRALADQAGPRLGDDGLRRLRWLLGHDRP
ncbi:HEAT repeat domain-containing protein [Actinomadura miaoliensis]|uniref:HEAT repeat domain-containing protein n=1 Tax=Actinomadura miaoliensis TaxID=430685 RepID=A0ABP7V842_9ACTN